MFISFLLTLLTGVPANTPPLVVPESESKEHVVFIHGIFDSGKDFKKFSKFANTQGYVPHAPSLEKADGRATMSELAQQISDYVAENIPAGESFHLVGFSMGGIVAKEFLSGDQVPLKQQERVLSLTTLGSPHQGSFWARLLWFDGVLELRNGSDLMERHAEVEWSELGIPVLSMWSPLDLMIMPSGRAKWEGQENRKSYALAHPLLIRLKSVFEEVEEHWDGADGARG